MQEVKGVQQQSEQQDSSVSSRQLQSVDETTAQPWCTSLGFTRHS